MLFWAACNRLKVLLDGKKLFAADFKIHREYKRLLTFFSFPFYHCYVKKLSEPVVCLKCCYLR